VKCTSHATGAVAIGGRGAKRREGRRPEKLTNAACMICSKKMVLPGPAPWGGSFPARPPAHKRSRKDPSIPVGRSDDDPGRIVELRRAAKYSALAWSRRKQQPAAIQRAIFRERYFYFIKRVKRFGAGEIPRLLMQGFFDARIGYQPHDGHDHIEGAGDPGLYERERNCHGIDRQRRSAFPISSN
jgi:hypothetical protein